MQVHKRIHLFTLVFIVVALATFVSLLRAAPPDPNAALDSSIIPPPGRVEGIVFNDRDADGVQNPGETGLAGVTISLLQPGHLIDETVSDGNGMYAFEDVPPGGYYVVEIDPPGYSSTTPNDVDIQVLSNQTTYVDFGDRSAGRIRGTVFDDRNGNGLLDDGEPGLFQVVIDLLVGDVVNRTANTAVSGRYGFNAVWLGDYTVGENDPEGYTSTTPNQVPISLNIPDQLEVVDFGDRAYGTIEGIVFDDLNGNWSQDPGEPGIAGVTVQVLQDGTLISATLTSEEGGYRFPRLWLGQYVLKELNLPGYVNVTPSRAEINLDTPGQVEVVDFGDQSQSTINGTVFYDLNQNGVQEAGEPGLAGVEIKLGGDRSKTTNTDGDGWYEFPSLPLGDYVVEEIDPSGFSSTTPNSATVPLTAPLQVETVDFGDYGLPGEIQGGVFDDLNGNGSWDVTEPGLAGVTVSLKRSGDVISVTQTLTDGSFIFSDQPPGPYTVHETDPEGYTSTTANVVAVSVPPGGLTTVFFGDQGIGRVSGVVFNDVNGDGAQNPGEAGLPGVTVELLQQGSLIVPVTTDENGLYVFSDVGEGSYTVRETDPPGYVSTTPNQVLVSVAPGGGATASFGDQGVGLVSGVVFDDLDGDGAQNGDEPGIGGVTVGLWQAGAPLETTSTNAIGVYSFSGVVEGGYTVRETDLPGYVSTTPNQVLVSLAPGGGATASFGDQQTGTIGGMAFNDVNGDGVQDPGEAGLPGVTIRLLQGAQVIDTTTTGVDGLYGFAGVVESSYTVRATRPAGYINTTPGERPVYVAPGGGASASFGYQQVGAVSGVVFHDVNGNGVRDLGEAGLGGVVVSLETITGTLLLTTSVAGDGQYLFVDLPAANYRVAAAEVPGFMRTTPGSALVYVAPGGGASASFGYRGQGTVSGVAFQDTNGDGIKQPGESGLGGVIVSLVGDETVTTTTSGGGLYSFSDVPEGGYAVQAALPAGFVRTTPASVPVWVGPGGGASASFGYQGQGTVSGVAFQDFNGDGTQQPGESGLGGVLVSLIGDGGSALTTTTSINGGYSFEAVPEGRYTVQAALPAGFVRTTPGSVIVSVGPGGSASANFGYQGQGVVSGVVFQDANGNGLRDPGESGLGGVTVYLDDSSVTTAGDGSYQFNGVAEGSYVVSAAEVPGFGRTTPGSVLVWVGPGGSASADFGYQAQGTVSGLAFHDANGAGLPGPGEEGIGGVEVALMAGDSLVLTTTTLLNGDYQFAEVAEGSYVVSAALPADLIRTTPGSVPVWVGPGGSASADFGYQRQGTVSGVAFQDLNGNGYRDAGEAGLGGLDVSLIDEGSLVMTATTTGDGAYSLYPVSSGTYEVVAALPPGFARTTLGQVSVWLAPGGSASASFGYQAQGTVSGVAFNDANGNGAQDPGESGLGGVTVSLVSSGTLTTTTTGDGSYLFAGVAQGDYSVETADLAGFGRTTPDSAALWVAPGGGATANFGYQGQGVVSGEAYHDLNGDGLRNPGESGLGGLLITLRGRWTITATTAFGHSGRYGLTYIPADNYVVSAETPAGWAHTTPSRLSIVFAPGGGATANFGYQAQGSVGGLAFNDANGNGLKDLSEVGVGGLLVSLETESGDVLTTTTAGNGGYLLTQVVSGHHWASAAAVPGFGRTTPASVPVWLGSGGSASARFGYQRQGSLSGAVFDDVDGDGYQAPGETGLGGVTIRCDVGDGNVVTTTTVGEGAYLFSSLAARDYVVSAAAVPGFGRTTLGALLVPLPPGGVASADFGYYRAGHIAGALFNDLDGDGVQSLAEAGIAGVVVSYRPGAGDPVTTTTSSQGGYHFAGVEPGSYIVSAAAVPDSVRTTPGALGVSVPSGGAALANFGYWQEGVLSGRAFYDLNGDGLWTPGEVGLGGVLIGYQADGGAVVSTTSAGDGGYLFGNLTIGDYIVSAAAVEGLVRTTPASVTVSVEINGAASASFGYQLLGSVGGVVFHDTDGDGARGLGEFGLGGVEVALQTSAGMTVEVATTAHDGAYLFGDLFTGSYTLVERDPSGYTSTTPNQVPVSLSDGAPSANFGDLPAGAVSGVVFHDLDQDQGMDWAEPRIGGALVSLSRLGGSLVAAGSTVGNGAYMFLGVAAGDYLIIETNPEGFYSTTPDQVSVAASPSGNASFGDKAGYAVRLPLVMKRFPYYEVLLPVTRRNYAWERAFPAHLGPTVEERPALEPGELFYTGTVQLPDSLPPGGQFYLSAYRDAVSKVYVDDRLSISLAGTEVFSYTFSAPGQPVEPVIVLVDWAVMEQIAGQTVEVSYRDLYGEFVSASGIWLLWRP